MTSRWEEVSRAATNMYVCLGRVVSPVVYVYGFVFICTKCCIALMDILICCDVPATLFRLRCLYMLICYVCVQLWKDRCMAASSSSRSPRANVRERMSDYVYMF